MFATNAKPLMNPGELAKSPNFSILYSIVILELYYVFLCGSYLLQIAPKWQGMGFGISTSALTILLSPIAIVFFCMAVPPREDFRTLSLYFSVLTLYIPALVYLGVGSSSLYASWLYFTSLVILIYISKIGMPTVKIRAISIRNYVVILSIVIGFSVIQLARLRGIFNLNFDIYSIYDFRGEVFDDIGSTFNRFLSVATKLLLPLLIIYAWILPGISRWVFVFISVAFAILIFGYWQHKSAAFMPIAILILFAFLKSRHSVKSLLVLFLIFSFALFFEAVIYFMYEIFEPGIINALLGRRILFVPPLLTEYYIDYFSRSPKIYWYNITQHFGGSGHEYDLPPSRLIGYFYFGSEEMSANIGFIGSGFLNAGIAGVILYSISIAIIISYLNAQAKRLGGVLVFCLAASILHVALVSSDLFTALRSHGLLLFIVAAPFLRSMKRTGRSAG